MSPVVQDPLAALVTARLEDLAREASADGRLRQARRARHRNGAPRWPATVASGLRRSIAVIPGVPAVRSTRRGAPCPTC
jgi:hypothetical protein